MESQLTGHVTCAAHLTKRFSCLTEKEGMITSYDWENEVSSRHLLKADSIILISSAIQ